MELKGKKIAFLGDSITEGCAASCMEKTYWSLIAKDTGAVSYGYGIGGTRIAPQHTPSENPGYDRYYLTRVDDMIPDADIIVVFGGTNDFGHGDAAFGTLNDHSADTFCGAPMSMRSARSAAITAYRCLICSVQADFSRAFRSFRSSICPTAFIRTMQVTEKLPTA